MVNNAVNHRKIGENEETDFGMLHVCRSLINMNNQAVMAVTNSAYISSYNIDFKYFNCNILEGW